MVNCATLGWLQGRYVSISRQTSPPTSSQKVWFTPGPCCYPTLLCESYVCHTKLSALHNRGALTTRAECVVRVGLRLPMSFIRCVHTCLLWLVALWGMEMSMRLFTVFVPVSSERGLVCIDALPFLRLQWSYWKAVSVRLQRIKTSGGFCLQGATHRPNKFLNVDTHT